MLRLDPVYATRHLVAAKLRAADERRKRDEAEAATKVADDSATDVAVIEQRRRIAEACRILSQSPRRPYRLQHERAFLDLDVMGRRERNAVVAAGLDQQELADALIARVRRDRAEDERAGMDRSSSAAPLDRIEVLGRISDQQQATTRDWVVSGRLSPPQPPAATKGVGAETARPGHTTAAAIAARWRDHQRGG